MIRSPDELLSAIQQNIVNIVVIVVCLIVALKIYGNQTRLIESIKAEIVTENEKNNVLGLISQSEKRLKELRRTINTKDESSIINTLNTIAGEFGVKIIVIRPVPQTVMAGYIKHPYSLNVSVDSYHTLGKFISALENHPFTFSVDNLDVVPDAASASKKYKLQASFEVSTILIKE